MGLLDIGKDILIALYDNSPTSPMMDDNARAQFENLKRQREFDAMHPGWREMGKKMQEPSGGNTVGKLLVGAAVVGGAALIKNLLSDDKKDKAANQNQIKTRPQMNK